MTAASLRVLLTADTHVPDFARTLPPQLLDVAETVDLVIHAGDVTSATVLDALAKRAPVRAVTGNNDGADVASWGATQTLQLDIRGVAVAVLHDAGPAKGRGRRMRRRFPDAEVTLFGHSHIPMDVEEDGMRLINPGSPTWKRRQPAATFAVVTFGRHIEAEFRELPLVRR